jgi:RNA polymerase sigma factor for flagellar operon FliA
MGLIDAAARYDEARDVSFDGFVEHRIRGAMLDELRRHDHLPRRMRAETQRVARVRSELSKALGRAPQDDELAKAAETTLEHLHELDAVATPPAPLDPEMLLRDVSQGSDERIERRQAAVALSRAIGELNERLQLILSLHYVEDLTYREIADILHLSQPRISQLHSEALGLLRTALAEQGMGQRS